MNKYKYSIVIPCYCSSKSIEELVGLIEKEMTGESFQIIMVNDSSPDRGATSRAILRVTAQYGNTVGIDLAKNVGQHNAVMCGLNYAAGEYVISMDDDLQIRPEQIH